MSVNYFKMAKKTKGEVLLEFYETEEGLHKINTIRTGLANNTVESFPQIFATFAKSNLQILLGISFYSFLKKIEDPGKFTLNEIEFMSSLFKVDFDIMIRFVHKTMLAAKKQTKQLSAKKK